MEMELPGLASAAGLVTLPGRGLEKIQARFQANRQDPGLVEKMPFPHMDSAQAATDSIAKNRSFQGNRT